MEIRLRFAGRLKDIFKRSKQKLQSWINIFLSCSAFHRDIHDLN